jgi:hypothetical protein
MTHFIHLKDEMNRNSATRASGHPEPFRNGSAWNCHMFGVCKDPLAWFNVLASGKNMAKGIHLGISAYSIHTVIVNLVDRMRTSSLEGLGDACNQVRHLVWRQERSPPAFPENIFPDLEYLPIGHKTAVADAYGVCNQEERDDWLVWLPYNFACPEAFLSCCHGLA